ncbi:MAG: NUDIX domain-containing protein [Candidatus Falkowbacteria bacterium]|nr:NUDIX domain-containing protein [Candidatus Falkowbacteria bacterium]
MRSGVIIIKDKKILLIHRYFQNREYYVIPGGGVEAGESIKVAAIREAKEETSLDVKLGKKLWEYKNDYDKRINYFFLVTEFSGELKLGGGEAERNCAEDNYLLEWHNLDQLSQLAIRPEAIKEKIIKELAS